LIFSIGFADIFLDDCFILLFVFERLDCLDPLFLLVDFSFTILLIAFGDTFLTAFLLGSFFGFGFLTIAFFLITIS